IRLVCTMPTFQNPTGVTTTLEHRRRLLAIVSRHGVPVLEDDFQKDLRIRGRDVPSLRPLDRSGKGTYVRTFPKAPFPRPPAAPRGGGVVRRPPVAEAATALKRAMDLASSPLAQAAVASFCRSGGYDRHLRRMTRELGARHARAAAALERHLPRGAIATRPDG